MARWTTSRCPLFECGLHLGASTANRELSTDIRAETGHSRASSDRRAVLLRAAAVRHAVRRARHESGLQLLLEIGDLVVDLLALAHQPLDLFVRVNDRGVVTTAEEAGNRRVAEVS